MSVGEALLLLLLLLSLLLLLLLLSLLLSLLSLLMSFDSPESVSCKKTTCRQIHASAFRSVRSFFVCLLGLANKQNKSKKIKTKQSNKTRCASSTTGKWGRISNSKLKNPLRSRAFIEAHSVRCTSRRLKSTARACSKICICNK